MKMIMADSDDAIKAYKLVKSLQTRFVHRLNAISKAFGEDRVFEEVLWLRDAGIHGGGSRFEARDATLFDAASVNVSQVHYDDIEEKDLVSATAISTIIHPKNPLLPSIHIHISLTELRDGNAYWRIMADLNPSNFNQEDKNLFDKALAELSNELYEEGTTQGNKYFYIPALDRTRGVSHFYLENLNSSNKEKDFKLALLFGEGIIDAYSDIITNAMKSRTTFSDKEKEQQLAYHTLYLFQVLTLDRGTTSGLLIHSQNDVGIMGSLPTRINKELLHSWMQKVEKPQNILVENILNVINDAGDIDVETKEKLAEVVRTHYNKHPSALKMQASGDTIVDTLKNHKQ